MLKAVSSITNAIGALNYKGTWNASTNTPTLASGVGTKGDYYVVSVAGTTTLDGISNWGIGDWAVFNGSTWQRVEGGADLNGVNLTVSGTTTLSGLTASTALALNASNQVVSVTNTGTGNNVLATSPSLTTPRVITGINDTNGNELLNVTATASAVNELTLANAAAGGSPVLSATGNDTNISITLTPKGTGTVNTSVYGISIPGFNTAAVLSNDANGLVISQYGNDKVKLRGIGGGGANTQFLVGEGNSSGQPNYSFINDSDTGIFNESSGSPNKLFLVAGGVEYVSTATATTVVNDTGVDHDFRVEGDTDANLFFTDASTDRVGVGTNTPGAKLDVRGSVIFNEAGLDADFRVEGDTEQNLFITDASADRVGVGIATPATRLDVRGSTTATIRVGSSGSGGSGDEFGNLEFYWADPDAAEVKAKLYAKNVGNVGPGGGGAADLIVATTPAFGALTEVFRWTADAKVLSLPFYNNTVGGTNRDVFVDNTGLIGYVSSTRESKTNIADMDDVSWLSALQPVTFNRRKKEPVFGGNDGTVVVGEKYSDEFYDELEYGLIADQAEGVNPELCFYDIEDGVKVLRGIHYSKLIVPLLKRVQQLEAELATLKGA